MGQCCSYYVINTNTRNGSCAGTSVLRSLSQITHKSLNLDTTVERFTSMCVNILVLLKFYTGMTVACGTNISMG